MSSSARATSIREKVPVTPSAMSSQIEKNAPPFVDLNFSFDAGDPSGSIFGLAAQDGSRIEAVDEDHIVGVELVRTDVGR